MILYNNLNKYNYIENYTNKVMYRGCPITKYYDADGLLHRIDGPAVETSYENSFFIHGEEYCNQLVFIKKLDELEDNAILNNTLDKLKL